MTNRRNLSRPLLRTCGAALLAAAALVLLPMRAGSTLPAAAAEIDGVDMPDVLQVAGAQLRLNGVGLRTYSLFHVHIYLVGLYLPQRTNDAEAILSSDATKVIEVHFLHDVTAERAREAWLTGFRSNCRPPCRLPEWMVERFLAALPEFHKGDQSTLLFIGHSVQFEVNGRSLGTIGDPAFTRTILANFIGSAPPSDSVKRGLLGLAN